MDKRLSVLLVVFVLLAAVPAPVAAEETRTGGTVVVEEGETIDEDLNAIGGTVIVRGTVDGDLTAFSGNVFVEGEVTGDVAAFAGNVRINGTVAGDVRAAGGNIFLDEGGRVGGQFEAGAGNIVINGEIGETAQLGAGTITIGPSAVVGGDLAYDGDLDLADGAAIGGEVRQGDNFNVGFQVPVVPTWVGWTYGLLVNLLAGAVALLVFPRFSTGVAARATADPLRSGGVGLLLFVGIPVLLVILFISLVGIPLGLVGILVYPVLLWLGYVYGSLAVGTWLVARTDTDSRWAALAVGLLVVSAIGLVPILGGLVQFLVLLLGLGALALGARNRYRGRKTARTDTGTGSPETAS